MSKLLAILITLVLAIFHTLQAQPKAVQVWYASLKPNATIPANPLKLYQQNIKMGAFQSPILLYPNQCFQTISGIGGCFNEQGGEALSHLPKTEQQALLTHLFDSVKGCGFSFCRTAIGSSDFGLSAYTYADTPNDKQLAHFSIKRDEQFLLPYIKATLAIQPTLRLFASPWSPPAWMKASNKITGVDSNNYLKNEPAILASYANYFVKYLNAYRQQGVQIARLNPQNETDMNATYPSCLVPPKLMDKFITNYLVPAFYKNKVKTQIWAGTYRVYGKFEALELLANALLRKNIAGIGIQYTKPMHITDLRTLYPSVKMMHTEGVCYNGDNSVAQAQKRLKEVADYLCNGVENYAYWNMILNETGKSAWNWKQNALININRANAAITYNPDYAVMYLISKFIRPGDVRIAHYMPADAPCIAVKSAQQYKIIVQNDAETDKIWSLQLPNQLPFQVTIPAQSIAAILMNK